MAVQQLATSAAGEAWQENLVRRLTVSARHRSPAHQRKAWIARYREGGRLSVEPVPLDRLTGWSFASGSGDLVHDSGRFFAIRGVHVRTNHGHVREWWQPIIHQPEVGILGFLAKELDGVLHFLAQVKFEPGNVNSVQLSPTVQATPGNYLRAHNGAAVQFLDYFIRRSGRVLVDVIQSEQGSWFLGKRNRNMVLEVTDDVQHDESFAWLTLGEIYELMDRPNVVNMDTRAVLSCLPVPVAAMADGHGSGSARQSSCASGASVGPSGSDLNGWLTGRRRQHELTTTVIPLSSVRGWERTREAIQRRGGKYFRIIGVAVGATNREVRNWCQPLVEPCGEGLVALVVRRIDGVLHLLVRADVRPGYRDVVEIGPTVQCTPRNFADDPEHRPDLVDLVLSKDVVVRYDVQQSEEGGRFHRAVTRHMIVEVDETFPLAVPPDYCWLTAGQLQDVLRTSYQVNIEARSLLACLQSLCGRSSETGEG